MRDRTRRYESGKMLMDLAKYFATVTGVGSLSSQANWKMAIAGWVMAFGSWLIGFLAIPEDKEADK